MGLVKEAPQEYARTIARGVYEESTMSDHPNLDLMSRGYAAYTSGDMDTINQLFDDDVVWHVAGRSQISGDYTGKEQVFGFFGKLQELSDGTATVEVHDILADDEHGVAIVTQTATRNGVRSSPAPRTSFISAMARSPNSGTRISISTPRTSSGPDRGVYCSATGRPTSTRRVAPGRAARSRWRPLGCR